MQEERGKELEEGERKRGSKEKRGKRWREGRIQGREEGKEG